ncbi:hypothetical protein HXX76_015601 [Chlamydomonas incerta]|uniref:Uncharacterized protein n=1 Tax=Chlamydomonas incerta TaxID=51695 RepID=A0A835SGK2_CHLIN|nr:hypothetical protein HXX76_015601 [Chlamydomonas incerta]|eukprot:KAG2423003.1 hypothetical protein HXX76_015601 [Chlamydomonas incerta]
MSAGKLAGAARKGPRSSPSRSQILPATLAITLVVLAALLSVGPKGAAGASWFRHPNCSSPCSEPDHLCVDTGNCHYAWGSCPEGTVQTSIASAVDTSDCRPPSDCTPGGCEEGWAEVAKTACIDVKKCLAHAGFCYSETCCRVKPQASCCPQLQCSVRYADCDVAQQRVLNDTSRSDVGRTRIAHTGSAAFPFYTSPHVPAPGADGGAGGAAGGGGGAGGCEAVRVWGRCFCNDGASVPGCDPFNSATWTTVADDNPDPLMAAADPTRRLPPGLSQLCVVLPPDSPPPAAPPASPGTPGEDPDYEEGSGTGNGTRSRQNGQGKQHGQGGSSSAGRQATVAVVVVACVLAAGGCVLGVSWCCGLLPDVRSLMRLRGAGSYEPVFTGQSYTPGLQLAAAPSAMAPADIPWNRFLAALQVGTCTAGCGTGGGTGWRARAPPPPPSATAASSAPLAAPAAAAGGGARGEGGGGTAGGGGGGAEAYHGAGLAAGGGGGGYGMGGPDGLGGGRLDDGDEDEVFTLEERPARGPPGYGRRSGPTGAGTGGRGAAGFVALPASAELEMGQVAPGTGAAGGYGGWGGGRGSAAAAAAPPPPPAHPQFHHHQPPHQPRGTGARYNQFGGGGGAAAGVAAGVAAAAGVSPSDVIHTRPMRLDGSDHEGGGRGGGGGGGSDDDDDLDAPITMPLTTPQTTGQDPGRRR